MSTISEWIIEYEEDLVIVNSARIVKSAPLPEKRRTPRWEKAPGQAELRDRRNAFGEDAL